MRQNLKPVKTSRIIPSSCIVALLVLAIALLCPNANHAAMAEDATDQISAVTSLNVGSMISIALQPYINIDVTPQDLITFGSNTAKLTINTNNVSGYSVYMQTTNGTADLVSTDSTNTRRVASITKTTSQENFAANTWGYSFDTDKRKLYEPISIDAGEAILSTETATTTDTYDLTFGVAVGADLPMGTYNNSVLVSVIANPSVVTGLEQLTYMQGMTPDICRHTAEGTTKQLIDTRDGNSYWVAKLKDGNCWMTQNLALDITTDGLKATDTDISVDWNERSVKPPLATNDYTKFGTTTASSWSDGKVILATPDYAKSANIIALQAGEHIAVVGANVGFVDVSSKDWKPTFEAQEGTLKLPDETLYEGIVAANPENKTYDSHYLVGNYYTYYAATAGLTTATNINATGSICPKNWKLPKGGASTFDLNGSPAYLLRQYGLATSNTTGVIKNDEYNVAAPPLYFIRTGRVGYVNNGALSYPSTIAEPGLSGLSWTSTATYYYGYNYRGNLALSSSDEAMYKGGTVRCLVQSN